MTEEQSNSMVLQSSVRSVSSCLLWQCFLVHFIFLALSEGQNVIIAVISWSNHCTTSSDKSMSARKVTFWKSSQLVSYGKSGFWRQFNLVKGSTKGAIAEVLHGISHEEDHILEMSSLLFHRYPVL